MKTRTAIDVGLVLTLVMAIAGGYWVIGPFIHWPGEIFGDYDPADLIRRLFPIHIVNPSWIRAAKDDVDMMWCFAEVKARAAVVVVGWLALMTGFVVWVRHTRSGIRRAQLPQP